MSKNFHPFHLVDFSPWPYTLSCGLLSLTSGLVIYFQYSIIFLVYFGIILIISSMTFWFRDIVRESTYQGHHSLRVITGLKIGMILFIVSEICFFFSFFWAFFHSSLSPAADIGCQWPPQGISVINPFAVPLLNTSILLGSGASITWCHHALVSRNRFESILSLGITIFLGLFFTLVQLFEYIYCPFSISDSVYGTVFFVATGFHGLHVIVGTILLIVSLLRMIGSHFSSNHHFGFEAAAWYWHFVDVVWLFLFVCIYWWGSKCFFFTFFYLWF